MMTAQYVDYWGPENLVRWQEDVLHEATMPEKSRLFLRDVGLPDPKRLIGMWDLEWDGTLPTLENAPELRVLANNYGIPCFFLNEAHHGVVEYYLKAYEETGRGYFVNSSIEQFALSLTAYDCLRGLLYDDPLYHERVSALEEEFVNIDAAAMADEMGLWSTSIFEMRLEKDGFQ
jgi:hypothetical protein